MWLIFCIKFRLSQQRSRHSIKNQSQGNARPAQEVQPHQSALSTSLIFWFGSTTKQDRQREKRTIKKAERLIDAILLSFQDLYTCRSGKQATNSAITPWTRPVLTAALSRAGHDARAQTKMVSPHRPLPWWAPKSVKRCRTVLLYKHVHIYVCTGM